MSKTIPKVLVAFDSMKNSNTGYYYFGKGLGNALIKNNQGRFGFTFYLHRRAKFTFNGQVLVIWLSNLHKFFFANRNKYQIIHLTDQECRLRPSWVNGKKIMTIHDLNRLHTEAAPTKETTSYMQQLDQFINEVDHVVAISNFVAEDVKKHFPKSLTKLSVIYNGTDKPQLIEGHKPALVPTGDFLFTIGMLLPHKGFQYLPCLLEKNDLKLVIAGIETPYKDFIIAEARKYNCEERIIITGPVTDADKAWYYANCKAFMFPSIAEGFGLPVIEAMHFGKPVFLARRTSLPEIGGDAAYYFDSFEATHMRGVLQNGLKDFALRSRAMDAIAQAQKFSWDNAAKSYLQLYEKCLGN